MATSSQLRGWYANSRCNGGMYGKGNVLIATKTFQRDCLEALDAFSRTLLAKGYEAEAVGTYNCRRIGGSTAWSLHAYAIAIDIDPYALGNPFVSGGHSWSKTKFTKEQVDAVYAIKTVSGKRVWNWGGYWRSKQDYMHWQIDVPPNDLATGIRWSELDLSPPTTPPPSGDDDMALLPVQYGHGFSQPPADSGLSGNQSAKKEDVKHVQLLAQMDENDADGVYGNGTAAAIGQALGEPGGVKVVNASIYGALLSLELGGQAINPQNLSRGDKVKLV